MLEQDVERRRRQNLSAPRVAVSAVTPSIRSFGQAIDRQRRSVERVPALRASRPKLAEVCRALDEAEVAALALWVDEPSAELPAFAEAARAVNVPVLRSDLLLEEFQIYESRAAGADAVLLHAPLLEPERLARLCFAARSTHMAPCIVVSNAEEVARAAAAKAEVLALYTHDGRLPEELLAALPRRAMVLALPSAPGPLDAAALRGHADALLDFALGQSDTAAADFRRLLEE